MNRIFQDIRLDLIGIALKYRRLAPVQLADSFRPRAQEILDAFEDGSLGQGSDVALKRYLKACFRNDVIKQIHRERRARTLVAD